MKPNLGYVINTDFHLAPDPYVSPERRLLAAVLERAIRDLDPNVDEYYRKKAIEWFTVRAEASHNNRFPFRMIIDYLNLGCLELLAIRERIRVAKRIDHERG